MSLTDPGGAGKRAFKESLRTGKQAEKQIRDILNEASRDAARNVLKLPGNSVSEQIRRAQYGEMRAAMARQQSEHWANIGRSIQGGVEGAKADAVTGAGNLVQSLGAPLPEPLLDGMVAAAESSAERVSASVGSRIELSARVYKNDALASGKIDRIINNGIALGKSAREIADEVIFFINPNTPGGASYAAMRLARTEINNAFHETSKRSYKSQPWVNGVQWNLSGSHPRHDICNDFAEQDGFGLGSGVFPKDRVPTKPHPHCLCSITAMTLEQDEFIDQLLGGDFNEWLTDEGLSPITD